MAGEIMSIRLSADGLSFWTGPRPDGTQADVDTQSNYTSYTLSSGGRDIAESVRESAAEYKGILTARGAEIPDDKILYANTAECVLIPDALFEEKEAEKYMALHGYLPCPETYIVCSKAIAGTVAVMRLNRKAVEALGCQLGKFAVAHLLQYNMLLEKVDHTVTDRISVYLSPTLCHITAWTPSGMVLAESYPYMSTADLTYFLSCALNDHGLGPDSRIVIRGDKAGEAADTLSGNFSGCICG